MILRFIAMLAALIPTAALIAQTLPTEADSRRHIETLASDSFEGRQPGTAGGALTANYIAAEFSAAGLLPGYNGNYFQPVALSTRSDDRARFETRGPNGSRIHEGEILALGNDDYVAVEAVPVLFVGYALDVESEAMQERRYDGKAILLLQGLPEGVADGPSFRFLISHYRERGAVAIIGIVAPDTPWDAAVAGVRYRQTDLSSEIIADVEAIIAPIDG